MREIKFRGKRVDNGEWVCGYFYSYVRNDNGKMEHCILQDISSIASDFKINYVDPSTVGQYTGLKDKNGKEVYEGDIMVATYGKWHEEPKGLTRICKVIYDNKTCSFRMSVSNSKVLVSFGDSRSKDIETIGNIYDNPELLKE